MSDIETVGVLGFGEAGRAVAEAFDDGETSVSVINRSPADLREMLAETSLSVPDSPADLAARSDLIVSPACGRSPRSRQPPMLLRGCRQTPRFSI